MRYVKTFVQEGRRYSEEISEDQYKFYTSPHYKAGDDSHKIFEIQEDEKPIIDEELAEIQPKLEIDEHGARERYEVRQRSQDEIESRKLKKAETKRKDAETNATVTYKGKIIKADDKAVNILSAYIQSGAEEVTWKTKDGSWLVLNQNDMKNTIRLIALKKKELFEKEFMETI